jgi:hypothetical protein
MRRFYRVLVESGIALIVDNKDTVKIDEPQNYAIF